MLQPDKAQCIIWIVTGKQLLIWKIQKTHLNSENSWAVLLQTVSTSTEKMQFYCNTHIYTVCHYTIMSFHQEGTGDRRIIFHPEIDNK